MKKETYFMADPHFDHFNVIKYSNRPYQNVDEMNNSIIDNINAVVKETDDLYIVGDFWGSTEEAMKSYLRRIKCKNLFFIYGNHDKKIRHNKQLQGFFKSLDEYKEISINDPETNQPQKICLFHYPILEWNGAFRGSWMLHGHTHGNLEYPESLKDKKIADVGLDCWNQFPVSFTQLKEYMKDRKNIQNESD